MKETVLEFCYKDDALGDPMINDYHIYAMGFATPEQVETIKEMSLKINTLLQAFFLERDLKLIDFKLEFGLYQGRVILADEISPDTCRLWDVHTNKRWIKTKRGEVLGDVESTYQEVLGRLEAVHE